MNLLDDNKETAKTNRPLYLLVLPVLYVLSCCVVSRYSLKRREHTASVLACLACGRCLTDMCRSPIELCRQHLAGQRKYHDNKSLAWTTGVNMI